VKRARLQLVGVTALLLACKYEEIHPPEVRDFVFITDRAYTRQEVVNMEQEILHELKFHLTVPTAYPFLLRYLHLVNASSLSKSCANYFMERTLQEHNFLDYRPSLIAAAAVVLAINNEEVIKYECPCNRDLPGIVSTHPIII
jgi:cyclin B